MKIFADGTVLLQEGTIFDNYIIQKNKMYQSRRY